MTIRIATCFLMTFGLLFLPGCERPAPKTDITLPEITVFVGGVRGRNYFRTADGPEPKVNCIFISEMPTQLIMIAGDAGGLQSAGIRVSIGTIARDTVVISPLPPEGSHTVTTDSGTDTLEITLTPPSPTTVRTGATASLEVSGTLPMAITAFARDRSGNNVELATFFLRSPEEGVPCRGR